MAEIFSCLLVFAGHCFGDFVFQTAWITNHKSTNKMVLAVHSVVYTVTVLFFFFVVDINYYLRFNYEVIGILLFSSHAMIDYVKCKLRDDIAYKCKNEKEPSLDKLHKRENELFYQDQALHLIILGICFAAFR